MKQGERGGSAPPLPGMEFYYDKLQATHPATWRIHVWSCLVFPTTACLQPPLARTAWCPRSNGLVRVAQLCCLLTPRYLLPTKTKHYRSCCSLSMAAAWGHHAAACHRRPAATFPCRLLQRLRAAIDRGSVVAAGIDVQQPHSPAGCCRGRGLPSVSTSQISPPICSLLLALADSLLTRELTCNCWAHCPSSGCLLAWLSASLPPTAANCQYLGCSFAPTRLLAAFHCAIPAVTG